jgi:uncharacterized protein
MSSFRKFYMTKEECFALLSEQTLGRLGCVILPLPDAISGEYSYPHPYVVPINYVYEDGFIYSHCLDGKKLYAMRKNPWVCLQVDKITNSFAWQSVIVEGKFEEVKIPFARKEILKRFLARFPEMTPVETRLAEMDAIVRVFSISVENITGRIEEL